MCPRRRALGSERSRAFASLAACGALPSKLTRLSKSINQSTSSPKQTSTTAQSLHQHINILHSVLQDESKEMVQPRLSQCIRLARVHSRTLHSSSRTLSPISVADLLESPPANPNNVIVNGVVRSIRNQKTRSFASIGDGSSLAPLQALPPDQAQR